MNKILTIEPLIDRDQLALILGVNPQTISLMRRRKEIPTHQIPPPIFPSVSYTHLTLPTKA